MSALHREWLADQADNQPWADDLPLAAAGFEAHAYCKD